MRDNYCPLYLFTFPCIQSGRKESQEKKGVRTHLLRSNSPRNQLHWRRFARKRAVGNSMCHKEGRSCFIHQLQTLLSYVRPVSVLQRDALTSQLFRRPELIDLRLHSYRNSSLTPRTSWSPWSGYEEFRRAVILTRTRASHTAIVAIRSGESCRILSTRDDWL